MKKFIKVLIIVMLLALIGKICSEILIAYRNNYYNGFLRAELNIYTSTFTRDDEVKYDKALSYRINSPEYNDAMFYKEVAVTPNTAYKVSCKVKTENVQLKSEKISDGGVHISIPTTTEKSRSIVGTTENWEDLTLYFNSKNRTSVNIAFRMGGNNDNCKGTAWFADLKLEQGMSVTDNNWNYACFIFKNVDVKLEQEINLTMTDTEIYNIRDNIERFEKFVERYSRGSINATCDIIEIDKPVTSVSYDEQNGYFVSGNDISNIINAYLEANSYQHIFAIIKFGDDEVKIPVNDWLGLGSMTYRGIGFSNIRVPGDNTNRVYQLSAYNQFPEEVFVHEFLHDLERISKEEGIDRPVLHDNDKYGYVNDLKDGLKRWYEDYMGKAIEDNGNLVGIAPEVYTMKPVGAEHLEYSLELDFVKEPENIFEEIILLTRTAVSTLSTKMEEL